MNLDDKGKQQLLDHIHKNWGDKFQCAKCYKSYEYKLGDVKVYVLMEYTGGGISIGGAPQTTIIPIICAHCGYIELLNVGFVKPEEEEKPSVS